MTFLLIAIAFVIGIILSGRIIAAVHAAETSIHDRIRSLEERLKEKL